MRYKASDKVIVLNQIPDSLPDKGGALLRVALADIAKAEANPKYEVFMGAWHETFSNPKGTVCEVCLAGSVIAFSLNLPITMSAYPDRFRLSIQWKLRALNCIRNYDVVDYLEYLETARSGKYLFMNSDVWEKGGEVLENLARRMGITLPPNYERDWASMYFPEYETDRAGFMKAQTMLAEELEKLDL